MTAMALLPHPRLCPSCRGIKLRMRMFFVVDSTVIHVKTWCRRCGEPALLQLKNDYESSLLYLHMLDTTAMSHSGGDHAESGGWGVRWRFDEVLRLAFQRQYEQDERTPYWPKPPWSEENRAEHMEVDIMSPRVGPYLNIDGSDKRRQDIEHTLNQWPGDRDQLAKTWGQVWDEEEMHLTFHCLGFHPPFALVQRRVDGLRGSLLFQQECYPLPTYFFGFDANRVI